MKRAIVLGGGGARGSYEIGVWKALNELGIDYQIVTGTSVGSLNGALMVQRKLDLAYRMWEEIDTTRVLDFEISEDLTTVNGMFNMLNSFTKEAIKKQGVSSVPLEQLLKTVVSEDEVRRSDVEFGLVTVEAPSMKPFTPCKAEIPQGKLIDYLMASSACFPAMHAKEIDGKTYIDGGYYDNMPIELAVKCGADEVIAVNLKAVGVLRNVKFPNVKVTIIEPSWDLGALLIFDQNRAKRNIALGYNDFMKQFDKLDGRLYTFRSGESDKNYVNLADTMNILLTRYSGVLQIGGKFNLTDETCAYVLAKTIRKRWKKKKISAAEMVTVIAEMAGEILEIDPMEIYSFEDFNFKLINKLVMHERESYTDLNLISDPAVSIKEYIAIIHNAISPLSPLKIMLNVVSMLKDESKLVQNRRNLYMLATVSPVEFLAAFYVMILHEQISSDF